MGIGGWFLSFADMAYDTIVRITVALPRRERKAERRAARKRMGLPVNGRVIEDEGEAA